ncbi:hypothetical protein [Streptomyces sp. NPDC000880]
MSEIADGHSPRHAAMLTAGHTIVFSAATVRAAPATLLVVPPHLPAVLRVPGRSAVALTCRC